MAKEKIFKGEDRTIEVELQQPSGVAVDISGAAGVLAIVKDKSGNEVNKWSDQGVSGTDVLTITDGVNGKYEIKFESAKTLATPAGNLDIETMIEYTDAGFANNTRHRKIRQDDFAVIIESDTEDFTDLTP